MTIMRRYILVVGIVLINAMALFIIFSTLPLAYAQGSDTITYQDPQSTIAISNITVDKAHRHLVEVMDKYHLTFDVYTDVGSGGNHFVHRAQLGVKVSIDDTNTQVVHSGATAIKNVFTGTNNDWGGWSFQNGVLLAGAAQPTDNWGTYPNAGYNLSDATTLTFWARGELGGERVEFYAFGLDGGPYNDSAPKRTMCGDSSKCFITLTNTWQLYSISLTGLDLSYIIDGFGWVTNAPENGGRSITFYLDDIQYNKSHLDDLRFLTSYVTNISSLPFDEQCRNVAFTYDNALALIAFVEREDWVRAQLLADAFVYAQEHDRFYTDGRVRNAYESGDLILPPGWFPTGAARLPGWWNGQEGKWIEDPEQVGSTTGNLAWVMIALLDYYEERGGDQYLSATIKLGDWIISNTYDASGAGGFTGGNIGPEPNPEKQLWKSTEHNLDLYAAFSRLYAITGNSTWLTYALHAKNFVDAMNPDGWYYRTGTLTDGVTINTSVIPLDAQSWSVLTFGDMLLTRNAITTAEISHTTTYHSFEGFDFNTDRDMPWPEGTAQMVSVYWILGEYTKAQHYLNELREIQVTAENANGKGIVAAPHDGLTTGFGWGYYNRLHVGATAWFILAEQKYNPYYAPLRASFTVYPASVKTPLSLVFNNKSRGNYNTSIWDFGDGVTSTIKNVTYTYTITGIYTVSLTVAGLPGIDTRSTLVIVGGHQVNLPIVLK